MPSASALRRHTPAIAGVFDATQWASKALFTAGGSSVTMPATTGEFDDVLEFLNGYGSTSGQDLGSLITDSLTGVEGTMTAGIDAEDRFFLSHSSTAFSLNIGANNAGKFGFTAGTHSSSPAGGAHIITASQPWERGIFTLHGDRMSITIASTSYTVPSEQRITTRQSLPVWLSVRTGTATLEDAMGAGSTAYIDATGRVNIEMFQGRAFQNVSDWSADGKKLWARLGGVGTEAIETLTNRQRLQAVHPCPGFLAFDRQLVELRRVTTGRDDRVVLANGGMASAGLPPLLGWEMTFRAGGPALGFAASREKALRDFFFYSRDKITFFPMWGDLDTTRGAIETRKHIDQETAYSTLSPAYSETQTIEAGIEASHYHKRKGGRLFLRRAPDDSQRRVEDYSGRALDVFQDVKFKFLDDPTR